MINQQAAIEQFEISPRFRKTLEDRVGRLDHDADADESFALSLGNWDHFRRHLRLVAVQRAEALRIRLFLDRSGTRLPRPLICL